MSRVSGNFLDIIVDPQDPNVDIVAVHGLNPLSTKFHAEGTWTSGDKLWLRDFLPTRLPNARVLLFGYNSNVAFETSIAGVREQAENLLSRLASKRNDAPNRPIVFVAHSLGGIIVKRALVEAKLDDSYHLIREATYGITFFATPHQGGNHAKLGSVAASIVRAVLHNPKNSFMESLKKDSLFSDTLAEDFRHQLENYHVLSFYETLPMGKLGIIVDKKSATLGLPGSREKQILMNADHNGVCKFASADDPDYEQVSSKLGSLVEDALKAKMPRVTSESASVTAHMSEFFAWLSAGDQSTIHKRELAKREPGTGSWVFNMPQYEAWLSRSPPRLWLHGGVGCGKTSLCSAIIQEVMSSETMTVGSKLCYFYFSFQDRSRQDVSSLLRTLIGQICTKDWAPSPVVSLYEECSKGYPARQPTDNELTAVTIEILREFPKLHENKSASTPKPHSGETPDPVIYIFMDALDEIPAPYQSPVLHFLSTLAGLGHGHIQILVTSRNHPEIQQALSDPCPWPELVMDTPYTKRDIHMFVSSAIDASPRLRLQPSETKDLIMKKLVDEGDGMFRLAALQMSTLSNMQVTHRFTIEKVLAKMPKDLDEAYERILAGIQEELLPHAISALRWLSVSCRTLYVEELNEACAIQFNQNPDEVDVHSRRLDPYNMWEMLGDLVTVDPPMSEPFHVRDFCHTISLSHFSVREFITGSVIRESRVKNFAINLLDANAIVARDCLVYLFKYNFPLSAEERFPLLYYAFLYWRIHVLPFKGYPAAKLENFDGNTVLSLKHILQARAQGRKSKTAPSELAEYLEKATDWLPISQSSILQDAIEAPLFLNEDSQRHGGLTLPDMRASIEGLQVRTLQENYAMAEAQEHWNPLGEMLQKEHPVVEAATDTPTLLNQDSQIHAGPTLPEMRAMFHGLQVRTLQDNVAMVKAYEGR